MFIVDFIQYLKYHKRYSNNTLVAYKKDLDQFKSFFQDQYLFDINAIEGINSIKLVHIRSWMALLSDSKVQAKTIARKLSSIKSYFKYLKQQKVISSNIVAKISAPKFSKKIPQFVSPQHMGLLFDQVDFSVDFAGKRDQLILELLYLTGMRKAELIALEISNVNFETGNLQITGKGNKQRLVPLHPQIFPFIKAYLIELDDCFPSLNHHKLLCTDKGQKLYPKFVYNTVKKYLSLITTLKKKSPHILRHTFATHMMNNGADLNAIKTLLGHASLASTQVYTHNSIKKLQEIYKKAHPKS